jgi:hypothetical protein
MLKYKLIISFLLLLTILNCTCIGIFAQQPNYPNNKEPLQPCAFIPLPLGAVAPRGWLLHQLELQRDGLSGHAEELYEYLRPDNAWLGGPEPDAEPGSPRYRQEMYAVPLYVKGLVPLAYLLKDDVLIEKIDKYVNWFLDNQQANGLVPHQEYAASMIDALLELYEVTNDERLLESIGRFATLRFERGQGAGVLSLESLIFLYNRTNLSFIPLLAQRTHNNMSLDWANIFTNNRFYDDYYSRHGVRISRNLRYPVLYSLISKDDFDRTSFYKGNENLMRDHGQASGMNTGDELLAGKHAWRGAELCAVAKRMSTNAYALHILGDPAIGDQIEKVAFNAWPACLTSDLKGHTYYIVDNLIEARVADYGFQKDYQSCVTPSPLSGYPCCNFRLHMGWPKYVKGMWAATGDNGLAALSYGPSQVKALVGDSVLITITTDTHYPFDDNIKFVIEIDEPTEFSLQFRIPGWSVEPAITVNQSPEQEVTPESFHTINRLWSSGDVVELIFHMVVSTSVWDRNAISLERGPIVYTMDVQENWHKTNRIFAVSGFSEYEITTNSLWSRAFYFDPDELEESIIVEQLIMPDNPFDKSLAPVKLLAPTVKLSNWRQFGLKPAEPPISPAIEGSEPEPELVSFVPYGSTALRLTRIPLIIPDGATSLPNVLSRDDFKRYVVDNTLHIESCDYPITRVIVRDILGRSILDNRFSADFRVHLDISSITAGTYLISIQTSSPGYILHDKIVLK